MTRIIGIACAKGGVGKTTTAINLASALNRFGRDIVLVDANIFTPNVSLHLGQTQTDSFLQQALRGEKDIKEIAYMHSSGLRLIPSSIVMEDSEDTDIERLPEVLLDLHGTTEAVLVDSSNDMVSLRSTVKAVDDLIVVTTPDIVSVADALKTIRIAEELGTRVLGIVLNKIRKDKYELSTANIKTMLEKEILVEIPFDEKVREAQSLNYPVVFSHPDSAAAKAFKQFAANLIGY